MPKFFISKIKYFLTALIFVIVVLFVNRLLLNSAIAPPHSISSYQEKTDFSVPSVKVGNTRVFVELATSGAALQQGLSGRNSLAQDKGMLFVFQKPDIYRFWMPDMRFPIDIIWMNENKVIDIDENVSNEFNPDNPVFFTPSSPAQYALEVNAGFTRSHNINIGDAVVFNLQ